LAKTPDDPAGPGGSNGPPGLALTEPERDLLLKACQRYRASIPAYLKSGEEERRLLDALVARLKA